MGPALNAFSTSIPPTLGGSVAAGITSAAELFTMRTTTRAPLGIRGSVAAMF
jgi:hypothetical protein